ncbi:hypothetical protein EK21DRAFT_89314 [Setomelanomma holmii]|uniref:Uncharacterized protein n=1 Tax=Setomelanomma holmii TaxID=210430 RepID=A0A9P4HAK1_9PLEO|nr:hypothetical protein EK21DRAFT_89314 [Setomelanomma holmii]
MPSTFSTDDASGPFHPMPIRLLSHFPCSITSISNAIANARKKFRAHPGAYYYNYCPDASCPSEAQTYAGQHEAKLHLNVLRGSRWLGTKSTHNDVEMLVTLTRSPPIGDWSLKPMSTQRRDPMVFTCFPRFRARMQEQVAVDNVYNQAFITTTEVDPSETRSSPQKHSIRQFVRHITGIKRKRRHSPHDRKMVSRKQPPSDEDSHIFISNSGEGSVQCSTPNNDRTTQDSVEPQDHRRQSSITEGLLRTGTWARRLLRRNSHEPELHQINPQNLGSMEHLVRTSMQQRIYQVLAEIESRDRAATITPTSSDDRNIISPGHEEPGSSELVRTEEWLLAQHENHPPTNESSLVPTPETNLEAGAPPDYFTRYRRYSRQSAPSEGFHAHTVRTPPQSPSPTRGPPSPEISPRSRLPFKRSSSGRLRRVEQQLQWLMRDNFYYESQRSNSPIPDGLYMTPALSPRQPNVPGTTLGRSINLLLRPVTGSQSTSTYGSSNDCNASYHTTPQPTPQRHPQGSTPQLLRRDRYGKPRAQNRLPSGSTPDLRFESHEWMPEPTAPRQLPALARWPRPTRHLTGRPPANSPLHQALNDSNPLLDIDRSPDWGYPSPPGSPHLRPSRPLNRFERSVSYLNIDRSRATTPNGHHFLSHGNEEHQIHFPLSPPSSATNLVRQAARSQNTEIDSSASFQMELDRNRRHHSQQAREIMVEHPPRLPGADDPRTSAEELGTMSDATRATMQMFLRHTRDLHTELTARREALERYAERLEQISDEGILRQARDDDLLDHEFEAMIERMVMVDAVVTPREWARLDAIERSKAEAMKTGVVGR